MNIPANVQKRFLDVVGAQELIMEAEEAMRSAQHRYDNAAKLLAAAVCPFRPGDMITLPYHLGKKWEYQGRVLGANPPSGWWSGLYELMVAVLKKDGAESKIIKRVTWSEELEENHGKSESPTWRELHQTFLRDASR